MLYIKVKNAILESLDLEEDEEFEIKEFMSVFVRPKDKRR